MQSFVIFGGYFVAATPSKINFAKRKLKQVFYHRKKTKKALLLKRNIILSLRDGKSSTYHLENTHKVKLSREVQTLKASQITRPDEAALKLKVRCF